MFETALGILLAILILAFLPYLIFGGLIALAVVAVFAVAAICYLLAVGLGLPWWSPLPVLALRERKVFDAPEAASEHLSEDIADAVASLRTT